MSTMNTFTACLGKNEMAFLEHENNNLGKLIQIIPAPEELFVDSFGF